MKSTSRILGAFLFCISCLAQAQITSTFDTDADGWTALNATAGDPVYVSTGGNPGGFLRASDGVGGFQTMMVAPAKFIGNRIFSYGQFLRFDLKVALTSNTNSGADIQIFGGGISITRNTPPPLPNTATWTSYSLQLHEDQIWRVGVLGPTATKEQVKQVLNSVTAIHIGVEYNSITFGPTDIGMIDNVVLEQRILPPAPIISSFTPSVGVPGTSITISGSNFDPAAANNTVYFGGMAAAITSSSATSITVTVPNGAQYGPITVINKTTGLAKLSPQPFNPIFDGGGRIIPASFDPKIDIVTSVQTGSLAMADVDVDGWNDLAVTRVGNTGIDVYRNLGLGGDLTTSSFATKVFFPSGVSGTNGNGLRLVDLDGDGKLDMVTSGWVGGPNGGVFVTFRNISTPGTIAFETAEFWSGRSDESPVYAAEDIDGDGLPELISGEGSGGAGQNVWITQNMSSPGNIQFGYSLFYFSDSMDDAPGGCTIRDLNNDGKPELILKRSFNSIFTVFINTSTPGVISFGTNFSMAQGVDGNINVADFNQDGKNDLAWKQGFPSGVVNIRINTNSGGPLAATDFATEVILSSELDSYGGISLTDVNGDGKTDIMAVGSQDFGVFENVYTGGAFSASSFVMALKRPGGSFYPTTIVAGDLNGDTKPDLVFSSTNASSPISIVENINVHAPVISLTTVSPLAGAVGSTVTITGDYFSTLPSENTVMFGHVKATVTGATKTQLTVTVPAGASTAPVSVTRDRLTAAYHLPFVPTFSSGVTFDNTHFAPPVNFTLTSASYDVDAGDLNNDGKPDVIADVTVFQAYAFRNTHTTGNVSATSLAPDDTLSSGGYPHLKDLDGDGNMDVLGVSGPFQNLSTGTEINFGTYVYISPAANYYNGFADFNQDGKTDFVGIYNASNIMLTENRTAIGPFSPINAAIPTFSDARYYTKPAPGGSVVAADFDKDGLVDFAATNPGTNNVTVWKNNGAYQISTTQFTAQPNITVGINPARIYTGDMDVDGKVDIMLYYSTGTASTTITVLHNQSTGTISFNRFDYTIPAASTVAHISDLDGDGKPEIIVNSESTDQFFILKNTSSPGVMNASSFAAPFATAVNNPRGLTTGDLNLDGKPEIILTAAPNSLLIFENLIPSVSINYTTQPADAAICEGSNTTLTLVATGDTNLQYKWQIDNAGFVDLANSSTYSGVTTSTLTITNPSLSLNGSFYRCVVRGDNSTDTPSSSASLIINSIPTIIALLDVNIGCAPASTTLSPSGAGANEEYHFFDAVTGGNLLGSGVSFTTPSLTISTTYHISTYNTITTCESGRISSTVLVQTCNPPVVVPSTATAFIEGIVTIDLEPLISDADNNLDPSTLQIVTQPVSGAPASLNGFILTIDYTGVPFPGTDNIEIEICDLTGICAQQELSIELEGEIEVFTAISPNNDGANDKFILQYIDLFPDTEKNRVTIFNRWGDVVWEGSDYNNSSVVFEGTNTNGKELPPSTYFYKIEFISGRATKTGFLSLKR